MQPAIRDYYHLEELWGDKPVKMKIASAAPRLVKASAPDRDSDGGRRDSEKPAPRGSVRRVAPAERPASAFASPKRAAPAPAKRATAAAVAAKRAPAKRAAGARTTPAKRVVIRTTGVKSGAAKAARTGPRPTAKKAAPKR
jgi:ribosome-associated protein